MPRSRDHSSAASLLTLATVAFVLAILYLAHEVLLPLALAALLAFLLTPLVELLERRGLGRIPSVLVVSGLAFAVIGSIGWFVVHQLLDLATTIPKYQGVLLARITALKQQFGGNGGGLLETVAEFSKALAPAPIEEVTPVRVVDAQPPILGTLRLWLGPLVSPLETGAIVAVFAIFILLQREDLRDRLIRLAGTGRLHMTTQALDEAGRRVSRYLLMLLIVNGSYGVVVGVGLWLIGLPNPFLFGLEHLHLENVTL